MTTTTLSIDNQEMYEFYQTHNLDFEQTNLLFFSVLKQLVQNMDQSLNSTLASQLLQNITAVNKKMDTMTISMSNIQQSLTDGFSLKFNEFRQEYIRDITAILNTNTLEHVTPLIKDSTAHFIDRTASIIGEIIPQHQQPILDNIGSKFDGFHTFIATETSRLMNSANDKQSIEGFLASVSTTMSQTHNTLTTLISSSESRIENKINNTDRRLEEIKTTFQTNHHAQTTLQNNVTEMLKKFEKGITKGTVSEHVTINMLRKMYSQDGTTIEHVGQTKGTGDIMFQRIGQPKVLIEVKDHDSISVPKTDIQKFINDCRGNKCCGIMLAQNRSISHKTNYQIDVDGENVLLYVGNVNFDEDRISTAISIVETFQKQLDNHTANSGDYSIDQNVLQGINSEFNAYVVQKHNMLKMVREFNLQMTETISNLKLPELETYLSSKFATTDKVADSKCPYCGTGINSSFKGHLRFCKNKPKSAGAGAEACLEESAASANAITEPSSLKKKTNEKKK